MKKAQITGQPLIFIFIAIVAILTLVLGVRYVYKLRVLGDETQIVREIKEIEADLQKIYYLSYGSSEKFTYSFPSFVNKLCFLNLDERINTGSLGLSFQEENYIKATIDKNIFVFTKSTTKYRTSYSKLIETTNCFDIKNKINLIFTNNGQKVIIISA